MSGLTQPIKYTATLKPEFMRELSALLNKHNIDSLTTIPDYILAEHIGVNISVLADTMQRTATWKGEDKCSLCGAFGPHDPCGNCEVEEDDEQEEVED